MPEPIVTLNEESLRSDLRELVRKTVEDTLNGLLEAEADELVGAERYERTAEREATRAGHYDRGLTTSSGEVTIHMPKLKGARFTTAIIERYRRRESSVEEAMIEMYLAGVSTRRIEDVSEILWGSSVSAATVSNLNEKAFASVEEWRNRPLERAYPYVYVDGIYLKRSWGGAYENVAVMVAVGAQRRRLPRGHRRRRGLHGVVGVLAGLPVLAAVPRAARRADDRRVQGGGHGRLDRGGVPRCRLPALHRALLPQRARQGAEVQARRGRGHAQGDPRHGVARGRRGKGARGRGRARADAAR